MSVLSKEEFLQEAKLKTEFVKINGEKGVYVSEITAYDLTDLYAKVSFETTEKDEQGNFKTDMNMKEFNFELLLACIVDENGNRMFASNEIETVKRFPQKITQILSTACKKINGLIGDEGNESEAIKADSTSGESQLALAIDTQISS